MKKKLNPLVLLVLIFVLLFSCEKSSDPLLETNVIIDEFISSQDFEELFYSNPEINFGGKVDYSISQVESFYFDGHNKNLISVMISKNRKVIGQVIGYKIEDDINGLKTGHNYLMVYRDFRYFNFDLKTGRVLDYDLNYDTYLCGELTVNNNIITDFTHYLMPQDISDKYSFNRAYNTEDKSTHPCDTSGEGDISFGECYSCLKEAIDSDGVTEFICDALDFGFLCSGSVTVACIMISSTR